MAVITGTAGNDSLLGGIEDDLVKGLEGADTLDGGAGADSLRGGLGDDVYIVDAADVVSEAGGGGYDTVRASVSYILATGIEALVLAAGGALDGTGNTLANLITGGTGANHLYGLAGNDTLLGGNGNDTLDGGIGADELVGGTGSDVYVVDHLLDDVDETGGSGTDRVETTLAAYTLTAGVENLTLLRATGAYGTGNDQANTIVGGSGADTLDGGLGNDTLRGGLGNDRYIVGVGDLVSEAGGDGIDTVVTDRAAYTLTAGVENLILAAAGGATGRGNAGHNAITGSTGDDSLDGAGGHDTLMGGLGADTLDGGDGNDVIAYAGPAGMAGDIGYVTDGLDTVRLDDAQSWYISNVYVDQIELNENAAGFVVTIGDEVIFEADANGDGSATQSDLRVFSGVAMNRGVEITAALDAYHVENALNVDGANLNGADTIRGDYGTDTISAGNGNDLIQGRLGADHLYGGAGRDTFLIGGADDGYDYQLLRYEGDKLIDFDAGTATSSIDRIAFDVSGFDSLGNDDTAIGFATGNNAALNTAASELVIKTDAAVTDATIAGQIAALDQIETGLLWIAFNTDVGCAQLWYDPSPMVGGSNFLVANLNTIQSLGDLAVLNRGDFIFE